VLGVVDDIVELDALTKFGGQVLASGFLVLNGVQLFYVGLPDGTWLSLDTVQAMVLTMIVVVTTINAVNFIDGLDGLAAGVIGIGAVAFLLFSYVIAARNGESLAISAALLSAVLAGACAGFLAHNVNPAKIFMGDSGSMLLGMTLAGSALTLTSGFPALEVATREGPGAGSELLVFLLPILLPIAVLLLPFADLLLAIARRTARGESPFAPDKQHLHHRMLELGHSHRRAVAVMWLWAALIAVGGVVLALYPGRTVFVGLAAWFVVTVVATVVVPRVDRPAWTHHEDYAGPPPRPPALGG
jgi:UDP-GlcNAc:undecaprenyl-phosphate GlcNAc-1-phosphate transferase